MTKPSPQEIELIHEIQERISDLDVSEEYLEPKNLVRFVRDGQLNSVEEMIRKNTVYYETYDMDSILRWKAPTNFSDNFPWHIVGFDNFGGPIIVFPVGRWNCSAVSGKRDEFQKLFIKTFEIVWGLLKLKSKGKDYIPQFSVIVDLEGFGWRHYTNYEEAYVFGMFWKLLKPLMSEVTYAKMHFLGSDKKLWHKSLCELTKPDQFPVQYGGSLPENSKVSLQDLGLYSYILQNGNESY